MLPALSKHFGEKPDGTAGGVVFSTTTEWAGRKNRGRRESEQKEYFEKKKKTGAVW